MVIKILSKSSILSFILLFLLLQSCVSTKKVPYFTDLVDSSAVVHQDGAAFADPVIQPDDILSIFIVTVDPGSSGVVNQAAPERALGSGAGTSIAQQQISGYLVDKNGEIELAVIGKIKLAGLTTYAARDLIRAKVAAYYKNPSVQVRFANFKVTILGEVSRPSSYTVPNEKVSVLDALGLAGDLTIYGKRENVLLIRDNNGKKEFARLDLNSTDLVKSPYFYLRQNDVLYVEPNKGKAASLNTARSQTFAIIGTALSVLIVLLSRI